MSHLKIPTAEIFQPLLEPARYKGAHGGRGSGKSHFFAGLAIEDCLSIKGTNIVCIREVQKTLAQSSKRLIETKIEEFGVGGEFRVFRDVIQTPGDGLIIFQGMSDHSAESIKSLEGYNRAWIEEAQTLSERSLTLLRPTIRAPQSEIWASWNPRRKSDAIDRLLRSDHPPTGAVLVSANWRDNPWFPAVLEDERQYDLEHFADRYPHIWEGEYAVAFSGAYFTKQMEKAKAEGRIGIVAQDPLPKVYAFWDIGGAGHKADATSIWIAQFADAEIRVLDYMEWQSQTLGFVVNELREKGWQGVTCILPHDGVNTNNYTGKRFEDHVRDADFEVDVVPNQGAGAAMMRVDAARRLFPQIRFNEETTEAGREALSYYHERVDEARDIGLGPEHDWSSHAADAFGLMCIYYKQPQVNEEPLRRRIGGYA